VDVSYLDSGVSPAPQFFIYNDSTEPLQQLTSGVASDPGAPEPSSLWLCCVGIMTGVGLARSGLRGMLNYYDRAE
jgi:hypothetical protein